MTHPIRECNWLIGACQTYTNPATPMLEIATINIRMSMVFQVIDADATATIPFGMFDQPAFITWHRSPDSSPARRRQCGDGYSSRYALGSAATVSSFMLPSETHFF
jgi:hypothetical protein